MLTIVAMAAVATVVYATVAAVVRWIDNPDRTPAQRAASWADLVLIIGVQPSSASYMGSDPSRQRSVDGNEAARSQLSSHGSRSSL